MKKFKNCIICNKIKHTTEFYKHNKTKGKRNSWCISCCKIKSHLYYKRNKLHVNTRSYKAKLIKNYNFTIEQYNKLFNKQKGRCAICRTPQTKLIRKLSVDHCHKTGKIRGLLCITCNAGLGYFKDKQLLLLKAIKYLKL